MCLSDHSRVVGLLAIFAYLLELSKIGGGTIPCSLLELNILRRFLNFPIHAQVLIVCPLALIVSVRTIAALGRRNQLRGTEQYV